MNTSCSVAPRTGGGSTATGVAVQTRTPHGDAPRGIDPRDLSALFDGVVTAVVRGVR